jgi:hypothetical protein
MIIQAMKGYQSNPNKANIRIMFTYAFNLNNLNLIIKLLMEYLINIRVPTKTQTSVLVL